MLARVTYARPQDLLLDGRSQFSRGGLLVKANPPGDLDPGASIELELVTPFGTFRADGRVIQALPGAGVAIGFEVSPPLTAALEKAEKAGSKSGSEPVHEWLSDSPASPPAERARPERKREESPFARIKTASKKEQIEMALHGTKPERAAAIRHNDKSLHPFVLRNPGLQLDEVVAIARMTTVAPELLKQIADRREWFQRPEIASALVRNPKMPVQLAIKLIGFVPDRELRQLAKTASLRGPILSAVRRKVLGGR